MQEEVLYLRRERHLGDTVAILILLYNRHLVNGWPIKVFGPDFIKDLLDVFDFQGLSCDIEPKSLAFNHSIASLMPDSFEYKFAGVPFLGGNMFQWIRKNQFQKPFHEVKLPEVKIPLPKKEKIICFQFDGHRSPEPNRQLLTNSQIRFVVQKFKGNLTPTGVGGKDTNPYLPYEFRLGNIKRVIYEILCSERFMGIDSGISHVAGLLKIPGDVVLLHDINSYGNELRRFYSLMYPSLTTHKKKEIFFRKLFT